MSRNQRRRFHHPLRGIVWLRYVLYQVNQEEQCLDEEMVPGGIGKGERSWRKKKGHQGSKKKWEATRRRVGRAVQACVRKNTFRPENYSIYYDIVA